jgi:hypothetical protein
MLKRKWIIDNRGHLVGIWNDCRERDAAVVHFHQEPVLALAPAARSNDRAAGGRRGTARRRRVPGSILLPVLSSLFLAALVWADARNLVAPVLLWAGHQQFRYGPAQEHEDHREQID